MLYMFGSKRTIVSHACDLFFSIEDYIICSIDFGIIYTVRK
jgi:hypothetical protein